MSRSSRNFDENRIERCQEAADVGHELISHLAERGIVVDEETHASIRGMLSDEAANSSPKDEFEFWKAYAAVADLAGGDTDPRGIYYTRLFEVGKRPCTPPSAEAIRQRLVKHSYVITAFAFTTLILILGFLAYGTIVESLEKRIVEAQNEFHSLIAGVAKDTPFAPQGADCWGPPATDGCETLLENVHLAVRTATQSLASVLFINIDREPKEYLEQDILYVLLVARQVAQGLETYVYPMFAGALGASVFLLRQLFVSIGAGALKLRMISSAYLRIAVGTIAGIVIGCFWGAMNCRKTW